MLRKVVKFFVGNRNPPYWRYLLDRSYLKKLLKESAREKKQVQFPTKVAIIFIGTHRYINFFPNYHYTIEKYFLPNTEKKIYVFTDRVNHPSLKNKKDVEVIKVEHEDWPYLVLRTFKFINMIEKKLRKFSHVIFMDADVYPNNAITEKEFFCTEKPLFALRHPNFINKIGPFDDNPECAAYVRDDEDKSIYWQSCFFGGKTKELLELSKELDKRVKEDLKKNIIAKWHDESQLNKYIIENRDMFYSYAPDYAYPEKRIIPKPFVKKMIHVGKYNPTFHPGRKD